MVDLLPCPFCGGPAVNVAFAYVTCGGPDNGCPAKEIHAALDNDSDDLSSGWNTRPTPARIAALEGALRGMVLVCGRTGDAYYDFEEQAEAFYQETGYMRPGKSAPMEMARDDEDERRAEYSKWVKAKLDAGRAALASAESMKGE